MFDYKTNIQYQIQINDQHLIIQNSCVLFTLVEIIKGRLKIKYNL